MDDELRNEQGDLLEPLVIQLDDGTTKTWLLTHGEMDDAVQLMEDSFGPCQEDSE